MLAEFHRILAPGGHLVMNVAALESLRGDHAVLAEEAHRYERGELHAMVEAAGFHVERLTFTNASLFPIMCGLALVAAASRAQAGRRGPRRDQHPVRRP